MEPVSNLMLAETTLEWLLLVSTSELAFAKTVLPLAKKAGAGAPMKAIVELRVE